MKPLRLSLRALLPLVAFALPAGGQVIDLAVNDKGLAIGDKPRMTGLRINFRDRALEEVTGVNITIWQPYQPATGTVNGLAIGLPSTGAKKINGAMIGVFGGGTDASLKGLGVGGVGIGAGGDLRGIMLGGVGVGSGGEITGLTIGGVGVGSGRSINGIQIGGIGVGGGGDMMGLSVGGIGVGGGGRVTGVAIGGIGVGSGTGFRGIGVGGIGVGSGGDATGLMIGGVGVGAGGTLKGLSIGGVGVGAPTLRGVALSVVGVGAHDAHAIVLTGAYFKIENNGRFDGGSLAARQQHPGRAARTRARPRQLRPRTPRCAGRGDQHLGQRRQPPGASDSQYPVALRQGEGGDAGRRGARIISSRFVTVDKSAWSRL